MIKTADAVFFDSKEDFLLHCVRDPDGRGYTYDRYPIKLPTRFPVAFKFTPVLDLLDPRCIGWYVETDFEKAIYMSIQRLESDIEIAELKLARLHFLKNKR